MVAKSRGSRWDGLVWCPLREIRVSGSQHQFSSICQLPTKGGRPMMKGASSPFPIRQLPSASTLLTQSQWVPTGAYASLPPFLILVHSKGTPCALVKLTDLGRRLHKVLLHTKAVELAQFGPGAREVHDVPKLRQEAPTWETTMNFSSISRGGLGSQSTIHRA